MRRIWKSTWSPEALFFTCAGWWILFFVPSLLVLPWGNDDGTNLPWLGWPLFGVSFIPAIAVGFWALVTYVPWPFHREWQNEDDLRDVYDPLRKDAV